MRSSFLLGFSAMFLLCLFSSSAAACGESMFRVGKGVHYRAYSAPIPGIVLVYARSDDERAVANRLQEAGHEVLVVDSDRDLAMQLQGHAFDVIVAPAGKRDAVESNVTGLAAAPAWLPVFETDAGDPQSVRADYGSGVSSDDDIRKYLKAIHKSLKNKES